jgi:hypothetical protein
MYKTKLTEWKADLEGELNRRVMWQEISRETGIGYSTLIKHAHHIFERPDFATADKLSTWFNGMSKAKRRWTPMDYFEEILDASPYLEIGV